MTGPDDSPGIRPISVAELLAKNGTIGAPPPVTGRRRRRRGNNDAVTVADLAGEMPVVAEDAEHDENANGATADDETVAEEAGDEVGEDPYWSEPEARWPESPPQEQQRRSRPERSPFPLPLRRSARTDEDHADRSEAQPGAEGMSPDPLEDYADMPVDVMDTEVREAAPATEDSAYVRSYLRRSASLLFGGKTAADDVQAEASDGADVDEAEDYPDLADADTDLADDAEDADAWPSRTETMLRGGFVVFQSILAVAFGAGLFIAFDQLWRWNNIVALVLSVLVILGLVVGVRVVRKTEDIGSTLIAVAVGALVTLGPLALLQSG
ncbi:MAG: hypothetical protein J2P16_03310 [Mycobacterium sp.]|nr:hypothetical protein [Mycobacterium sp.]